MHSDYRTNIQFNGGSMYLKTETQDSWFERKSRCGIAHKYKRVKTIYHLQCDHCKIVFTKCKGDISPSRFAPQYSHFCTICKGQSSIKGQKSRRINLDKRIGEKQIDTSGYMTVYVGKTHPYSKSYGGRIREHVVVMERHIGRPLRVDKNSRMGANAEVVHHVDGDKLNNDIQNLDLMTVAEHNVCHGNVRHLVFELYKIGIVGYNRETHEYYIKDTSIGGCGSSFSA